MPRRYWLLKTEPDVFSFDDLLAAPKATSGWDGVRNFQARNFLRDEMKLGDGVLIYHSRIPPMAIVGVAEIAKEGDRPDRFDLLKLRKTLDERLATAQAAKAATGNG